MAEQLVERQTTRLGQAQRSPLKLGNASGSKISILSLEGASPSSLSPEISAYPANNEIPSLPRLAMINIANTTGDHLQTAKKATTPIFDWKYTSQPMKIKKRKDYTIDDYDSEYGRLSFDQHWSKSMQATLNAKQGSVLDTGPAIHTTAGSPEDQKLADPSDLQLGGVYNELSQVIIDELLINIQVSADGDIRLIDNRYSIRRVASIIETFITHNRARLMLTRKAETTAAPPDENDEAPIKAFWLAQLAKNRRKMTKTLSLKSPECYSRIIPVDAIDRMQVEPGRCIAEKTSSKKTEESRCTTRKSIDSEAARRMLQGLADLPKPRKFSKVAKLLTGVIDNAVCERYHRAKARNGLEKLCHHFSQPVDEKQKLEREVELTQLEQWISHLIQPLISHNVLLHPHEVEPCNSHQANDLSCEEPGKNIVQDVKQVFVAQAILLFDEKPPSLKAKGSEVAAFPHAGGLTLRHFDPYKGWNKDHRYLSPKCLVETIAKSKLTPGDIPRKGRIYISWHVGNFQWVKIGYTSKTTKYRIAQWEAQCGFDASEKVTTTEFEDQVSHPYRVERLIHAELKNARFEIIECQGCGKSHGEWFKADTNEARAIVKKWTDWMQKSDPYDENGGFRTDIEVLLPPTGDQNAKVIFKPAQRRMPSSRFGSQPPRRSSRIAAQDTSQKSKQK